MSENSRVFWLLRNKLMQRKVFITREKNATIFLYGIYRKIVTFLNALLSMIELETG
jgi:hypothetical protein